MRIITIILACLLLTGCYSITQYPRNDTQIISKSTINSTNVFVKWHKTVDTLSEACDKNKLMYGCAITFVINNNNFCIIHAIEPKDFSDEPLLKILGHELWHCLGAKHL